MIEAYSGYIAAYLCVGVGIYLIAAFAYIKAGETMPDKGPVPVLFFVTVAPLGLAGALLKDILLMCWDATKAWQGFLGKDSGTEELLMGLFWAYMAWLSYRVDQSGAGFMVFLCLLTTVYLWQSARAMQRLKAGDETRDNQLRRLMTGFCTAYHGYQVMLDEPEKIPERRSRLEQAVPLLQQLLKEYEPSPPQEVCDRYATLCIEHTLRKATEARNQRSLQHTDHLAWVRNRGRKIRLVQAAAFDYLIADMQRNGALASHLHTKRMEMKHASD